MRVGILIASLEPGGAQSMAVRLMDGLDSAGIDVFLLTLDRNQETPLPGDIERQRNLSQRVIRLSNADIRWNTLRKVLMAPRQWVKMEHVIRRLQLDVVISFMERANIMNLLSFSARRRIISIRKHPTMALSAKTPWKKGLILHIYPHLLHRATRIIFNSIEAAEDFNHLFPTRSGQSSIIYNFCDIEQLKALAKKPLPEESNEIFNQPVVITSGRLIHAKGQLHLLRAFKAVCQRNNEIRLVILGEGPLKGVLLQLCKDLRIQDRVFLPGFQTNSMAWVAKADLFVLPSLAEGFPNALLEAMALGVPVISTDCWSGPRELLAPGTDPRQKTTNIDNAPYGVLIPPLDGERYAADKPLTREEQLLAEAVEVMLNDNNLRMEYAKAAKQRADDFSVEKVITQWVKLIEEG